MRRHLRAYTLVAACLVFVSVTVPGEAGLLDGSTDLTGGWRWLEWFGQFNDANVPWIYHLQHGWLHVNEVDASSAWMWSPSLGWLYVSSTLYPHIYLDWFENWVYCEADSLSPVWFYDYGVGEWFNFWTGQDIAFAVNSQRSRMIEFRVTYSGTFQGQHCSGNYTSTTALGGPLAVSDGAFRLEGTSFSLAGRFTSDTTASIDIQWSGRNDHCDADYSGNRSYTATRQ
ncbi:hypothetical protein ACFLSJ_00475 [Verrucomicrobiota bacterium]